MGSWVRIPAGSQKQSELEPEYREVLRVRARFVFVTQDPIPHWNSHLNMKGYVNNKPGFHFHFNPLFSSIDWNKPILTSMFDFEKLEVYQKAKAFNSQVIKFITDNKKLEKAYSDQLRRASFSIMLNIAEGTGRFSNADRCNFFIIARGSVFECAAIFNYLLDACILKEDHYRSFYDQAEELSKMLFALIKNLKSA
jgi:four helix bundle protein